MEHSAWSEVLEFGSQKDWRAAIAVVAVLGKLFPEDDADRCADTNPDTGVPANSA